MEFRKMLSVALAAGMLFVTVPALAEEVPCRILLAAETPAAQGNSY